MPFEMLIPAAIMVLNLTLPLKFTLNEMFRSKKYLNSSMVVESLSVLYSVNFRLVVMFCCEINLR